MRACALVVLLLCGCDSLWMGFRKPHDQGACNDNVACWRDDAHVRTVIIPARQAPLVDMLFVIDNTSAMRDKQLQMVTDAQALFARLQDSGADYHIGLTSTDVGGQLLAGGITPYPGCESVAGDDGHLQTILCKDRGWRNAAESSFACAAACPELFAIQDDKRYIWRSGERTNVPAHIESSGDHGPWRAFACMAVLGDTGCEMESPLEAMRRALDGHHGDQGDFLRKDAPLGVFIVSDEDDCSVRERSENDDTNLTDCMTADRDAPFRCFNPDYRCMARSVLCDEALNIEGTKSNCSERSESYLFSVQTYVDFIKGLGKGDHILVTGLWPPRLGGPDSKFKVQPLITKASYDLNRAIFPADASCNGALPRGNAVGRPQLRLSHFADAVEGKVEVNLCSSSGYAAGMESAADRLLSMSVACLPGDLEISPPYQSCLVGDLAEGEEVPQSFFLPCSATCCAAWAAEPVPVATATSIVGACQQEEASCYCVGPSSVGACPGGSPIGVSRKEAPAAGARTYVRCAVKEAG